MQSDEVNHIQEVRYCLKTLREQMAARRTVSEYKSSSNGYRTYKPCSRSSIPIRNKDRTTLDEQADQSNVELWEECKWLQAELQEARQKHQEEREMLQVENARCCQQLTQKSEQLKHLEGVIESKDHYIQELQQLLGGMEQENITLQDKINNDGEELKTLRAEMDKRQDEVKRVETLEKEQVAIKEKIHHLNDMVKSQQRKIRNMIEELQNSRIEIQERDRMIQDLEEKVAFLEAENREMHDHMECKRSNFEGKPQVVYSKPIMTSADTCKTQPFIKIIETKS